MEVRTDNLHESCPLYHKYPDQFSPQRAYIEFQCSEKGFLLADWAGESGNAVPEYVHHKHAIRWYVDPTTRGSAIIDLFADEGFLACCQRINAGYEEDWDGRNNVGKYSEDALEAIDEVAAKVDTLSDELAETWEVEEWLFASSALTDHWPDGAKLDDVVKELERDAEMALESNQAVIGSIEKALLERALELFHEDPESLYKCHVDAMLKADRISEQEAIEWAS